MADARNDQFFDGLPVSGYKTQTDDRIDQVNVNKQLEERVLRQLDVLKLDPRVDGRWLALGRTAIEQGFMAANRAVFQPMRVPLPEDREPAVAS